VAQFTNTGELVTALERAGGVPCTAVLVSTFVQSARDAYPDAVPQSITASSLVEALLDEFPFEEKERSCVALDVRHDFRLPGRRDLLYLVLCTLAKNALLALRGRPEPRLWLEVDSGGEAPRDRRAWIRVRDNGPGIPPEVLAKLTREPVTTRAAIGGSGMGLMFCQRVMQAISGSIEVQSTVGEGTMVSLYFQPMGSPPS
jgi:two-component system response regulator PhcR